jgi:hypothetical protein
VFDTAFSYAGGASDRMIGRWLARQDSKARQRIRIATKVGTIVSAEGMRTDLSPRGQCCARGSNKGLHRCRPLSHLVAGEGFEPSKFGLMSARSGGMWIALAGERRLRMERNPPL